MVGDSTSIPPVKLLKIFSQPYDTSLGNEGYKLIIDTNSIQIIANTKQGQFYAEVTLRQLFQKKLSGQYYLPCLEILDQPQYKWRGMELDVSRHFFPKEVIKQYLDLMAKLKMNIFHWHLTDDQGWRIEIKKYPKLTEVGAWRTEKDGSKYGGYYTQKDIKEVVQYAAERFITVVPEIEMPGHSSAAIAAYPELSCIKDENKTVPNTWGVKKDIYCPNEFTFQFLKDVLDEVCALFPARYVHLGGDETPKKEWKKSKAVQTLMQKESLKNEEALQHYFMKAMEDYLATKGKRAIGWGEILKGGIDDSIVVMSWIDKKAGIKAARKGNEVIMSPRFFCYFDYPQSIHDRRPAWWMTYLSSKKVYHFTPIAKSLSPSENKHIIGGQANVWTEHITDDKQLFHHIYPRLAAISEALWGNDKNYRDFQSRIANRIPEFLHRIKSRI